MQLRRLALTALTAGAVGVAPLLPAPAAWAAPPAGCLDTTVPGTVEEQRLDQRAVGGVEPASAVFLRLGGFTRRVDSFITDLCGARTQAEGTRVARRHGTRLWRAAVGPAPRPAPPPRPGPAAPRRGGGGGRAPRAGPRPGRSTATTTARCTGRASA